MARRHRATKRRVIGDPRFNSSLVTRFVNYVMMDGKKTVAQSIVYGAIEFLNSKTSEQSETGALERAIENVRPRVEVKSRRVGGTTYQVPIEVSSVRQAALALRWLIQAASGRRGVPMQRALGMELLDAYNNQGTAVKKRQDTHRMAQANRAFAHYKW